MQAKTILLALSLSMGAFGQKYTDAQLLNRISTVKWTSEEDFPPSQLDRMDEQIKSRYGDVDEVNAGTVLAWKLGIGDPPYRHEVRPGTDRNFWAWTGRVWMRLREY